MQYPPPNPEKLTSKKNVSLNNSQLTHYQSFEEEEHRLPPTFMNRYQMSYQSINASERLLEEPAKEQEEVKRTKETFVLKFNAGMVSLCDIHNGYFEFGIARRNAGKLCVVSGSERKIPAVLCYKDTLKNIIQKRPGTLASQDSVCFQYRQKTAKHLSFVKNLKAKFKGESAIDYASVTLKIQPREPAKLYFFDKSSKYEACYIFVSSKNTEQVTNGEIVNDEFLITMETSLTNEYPYEVICNFVYENGRAPNGGIKNGETRLVVPLEKVALTQDPDNQSNIEETGGLLRSSSRIN